MTQSSASPPVTASVGTPPTAAVCPYLLASDGRWRSVTPSREHRCTVVAPAAIVALEKQRRLCLAAVHGGCATFLAADGQGRWVDDEDRTPRSGRVTARPLPRTAPLVLDHGRSPVPVGPIRDRGLAQGALLALMAVAFVAIVVARFSGAPPDGGVLAGAAGPSGTSAATMRPAGTASSGGPIAPSTPAAVGPSAAPTPSATTVESPVAAPRTYTVRSGDTLSGIAAEFGTTVRALAELNGIDDPSRLRIGQELQLPGE